MLSLEYRSSILCQGSFGKLYIFMFFCLHKILLLVTQGYKHFLGWLIKFHLNSHFLIIIIITTYITTSLEISYPSQPKIRNYTEFETDFLILAV